VEGRFDRLRRTLLPHGVFALALIVMLVLTQVVPPVTPALAAGPQAPNLLTPTRTQAAPPVKRSPAPVATPAEAAPASTCDQPPTEVEVPSDWQLALCEPFDDNANHWLTGPEEDENGTVTRQIQDGVYTWEMDAKYGADWWRNYAERQFSDFYVSADIQHLTGPEETQYGLSFRSADGDNFYMFLADDTKRFRVDLMYRGQWQTLIGWTDSGAITPGGVNQLAVKAEGRRLTFYINGDNEGEVRDSRLKTGLLGIAGGSGPGQASVSFDNLQVWVSPTGDNPTTTPTPTPTPSHPRRLVRVG